MVDTIINKQNTSEVSLQEIQNFAVKSNNEVRVIDKIEVGQFARQGDLYCTRIDDQFSMEGLTLSSNYQLAPGNTRGSRHVCDNLSCKIYSPSKEEIVKTNVGFKAMGPVVVAPTSWRLSHPEHADFYLPEGTYQITYQVNPIQMRRVLD